MSKKTSVKKVGVTYSLSNEELDRLKALRNVSVYIQDLVRGDMNMFVNGVVKPRLALVKDQDITVDIDKGTISTIPSKVEDKVEEEIK